MAYQLVNLGSGTYGAYDPVSQQARSFSSEQNAKQFFGTDTIDYSKAVAPTFDVSKVTGANADKLISFAPSAPPVQPINMVVPNAIQPPELPEQTGPATHETFFESTTNNLETTRKAVEDAYTRERDRIAEESKVVQAKIDNFNKKQEGIIKNDVQDLTQPFRQELEKSERSRLFVDENYQANQKLINELDGLLMESNSMIKKLSEQKVPGLAGIQQSPRIVNALNNVAARVGVIEAVMASRNNQINVAYNMIDRSVDAINADRNDQLNYYNTLLNFYESQKDEEGKKLIELDKQDKEFLTAQIGLLENDMERSQATADYLKELMISPETAKFVADAGITLNDSIETINKKMAEQAGIEQRKEEAKINREEALMADIDTPFYNKNGTLIRTADGFGFKDEKEFEKMTGMTVKEAQAKGLISGYDINLVAAKQQVLALMEKYWDAGILPTDPIEVATAKAMRSKIYLDSVRGPVGPGGDGTTAATGLYNSTIDEALMQGATPEEAVFAAMTLAETVGSKLDTKDQANLLAYARSRKDVVAPPAGGGTSGSGGTKVTAEQFGREIPGAIWKVGTAPVKASQKVLEGTSDVIIGAAKGIGDFFTGE